MVNWNRRGPRDLAEEQSQENPWVWIPAETRDTKKAHPEYES
jgi:hypothetical protein